MKRNVPASAAVWTLLLSGVGCLAWAVFEQPGRLAAVAAPRRAEATPSMPAPYAAESLAEVAAGRDPFRSDRREASAPYDATHATVPLAPAPPRPELILSGIVWGPVPEAVLEGLPGIDGPRVVRVGDVVARLTVKSIDPSRVVIAGMDTTWTLKVREPWR